MPSLVNISPHVPELLVIRKILYSKVSSLQFIGAAITLLRVVCSCQVCGETREPTGKEEQGQVQDCQFGSESWCGIHSRTGKEGEF